MSTIKSSKFKIWPRRFLSEGTSHFLFFLFVKEEEKMDPDGEREKKEKEREKKEKEREKKVRENPWWEQKRGWKREELAEYQSIDIRNFGEETKTYFGIEKESMKDLYVFTAQIYTIFKQIAPQTYIIMKGETINLVRDYVFIIFHKIMSEIEGICEERGGEGGGGGGGGGERDKIWMRDIDEAIDRQFPNGDEPSLKFHCKNEPKKTLKKIKITMKIEGEKEKEEEEKEREKDEEEKEREKDEEEKKREEEEKKEREKEKEKEIWQRFQRSKNAGLVLSVDLIEEIMKIKYSFKNMEEGFAIYMTSLMEYLTAEILEITYYYWDDWKKEKKKEIQYVIFPEYVEKAIENDSEFSEYFKDGINIKG